MINTVIFDLYETLINEVRTDKDPPPSPALQLDIAEDVYLKEYRLRTDQRMTGAFQDYASVLRDICKALKKPVDESLLERIQADRIVGFRSLFANAEDRIVQLLKKIKNNGMNIGLISNASHEEIIGFETCPLHSYLDCAVFSCKVGYAKPSPEIYAIACQRLNVSPEDCIYVGDGAMNELSGAAKAGMKPFQAAWFMERWPDNWRQWHELNCDMDFLKLSKPEELIALIESNTSQLW